MDFLTFLEKYDKEDVSKVKGIVESNKSKDDIIIKEAFNSTYPSKKEALLNLEKLFISEETAPKNVDIDYVKENIDRLKEKIKSLSEGDIRIIIHNHENKKEPEIGVAEEGAKKKRGRPRKIDPTKAPKNTGVVYGDGPSLVSDEELIGADGDKSKEQIDELEDDAEENGEEIKKKSKDDELIDQLDKLGLSDEELKKAVSLAKESTVTEELSDKIAQAVKIIAQLDKSAEAGVEPEAGNVIDSGMLIKKIAKMIKPSLVDHDPGSHSDFNKCNIKSSINGKDELRSLALDLGVGDEEGFLKLLSDVDEPEKPLHTAIYKHVNGSPDLRDSLRGSGIGDEDIDRMVKALIDDYLDDYYYE